MGVKVKEVRRQIAESHLRPLILTDGKQKYWDEVHVFIANPALMEEARFVELCEDSDTTVELRRMVDEGHFLEAAGAILDGLKYQVLWDWLAQHNTRGVSIIPVEGASEDEMLAGRQVQQMLSLTRGEEVEPDPNDPYTWCFRMPDTAKDHDKD